MIRLDYKYDPCLAGRGSANYVEFAVNTNVGNLRPTTAPTPTARWCGASSATSAPRSG